MPPITPKVDLYLPLAFWSEILVTLDKKTQTLSTNYGFGEVNLSLIVHRGKVIEVLFNDKIRVRGLAEKAGGSTFPSGLDDPTGKTE